MFVEILLAFVVSIGSVALYICFSQCYCATKLSGISFFSMYEKQHFECRTVNKEIPFDILSNINEKPITPQ